MRRVSKAVIAILGPRSGYDRGECFRGAASSRVASSRSSPPSRPPVPRRSAADDEARIDESYRRILALKGATG
jgi:hypothetical protein